MIYTNLQYSLLFLINSLSRPFLAVFQSFETPTTIGNEQNRVIRDESRKYESFSSFKADFMFLLVLLLLLMILYYYDTV